MWESHGKYLRIKTDKQITTSYLGDPEATRAAFDEEGFYKTGDIVELREGEIIFHGRKRDDCKCGDQFNNMIAKYWQMWYSV